MEAALQRAGGEREAAAQAATAQGALAAAEGDRVRVAGTRLLQLAEHAAVVAVAYEVRTPGAARDDARSTGGAVVSAKLLVRTAQRARSWPSTPRWWPRPTRRACPQQPETMSEAQAGSAVSAPSLLVCGMWCDALVTLASVSGLAVCQGLLVRLAHGKTCLPAHVAQALCARSS